MVPTLGGEPRRVGKGEQQPHLSPDGKWLITMTGGGKPLTLLQEIGRDQHKRIAEDLLPRCPPVWSPDGNQLLLMASDKLEANWWLLPLTTLQPVAIGKAPGCPSQWLPGDRVLYSFFGNNRFGDAWDLGIVSISSKQGKIASPPQRLTNSTTQVRGASVAADGTLVFAAYSIQFNLWNLAIDANTAKATSSPKPLTQNVANTAYPSISLDGKKLAYTSDIDGGTDHVWLMDLPSEQKRRLTTQQEQEFRPELSPDGSVLTYRVSRDKKLTFLIAGVASFDHPGEPAPVCTFECFLPWSWTTDNRGFFVTMRDRQRLGHVSATGGVTEYAKAEGSLWQAHPSPDGRWMALMESGKEGAIMKVAPLKNGKLADHSQWKIVNKQNPDLYRWSPDGNLLYFISTMDQFRCIYAQRLRPESKEPLGEPFAVYHSHSARLSMGVGDSGAVGLAVAKDKIVFAQSERTGNVWIGKLDLK